MLKIRLGIVGPDDSVQRILEVAGESEELILVPFPYRRTEETETIIRNNRHRVDQWFFSGQAPYHFALSKGLVKEHEASYPPLYGSSLLGTLLEILFQEGHHIRNVSLDTIQQAEIENIRSAYAMDPLTFHLYSYTGYQPAEDIIRFHRELYEQGTIDVAITCIREVYHHLQEVGIPCYRVVPSQLSIRFVLQFLKVRGQSSWYRKSQLAILGIEVLPVENTTDQQDPYQQKRQELELNHVLLDYAQRVKGSYIRIGDGLYFIYTTRGELELHLHDQSYATFIHDIYTRSRLNVRLGIGYGLSALDAEQNVRLALQYARRQQSAMVVIVNEDKEVQHYDPAGQQEVMAYQQRQWGKEWEERFKEANISPATVAKIESLARHYRTHVITAQELSRWLHSTERNARRLLTEMERLGLAKVTGEEQPGQRGRPRKVYELKF
ncbi:hypothetical protein CathTA2_2767 [Caldalkalibacillus thermarum TA2.A1]|uniref:Transcriptional regulator n=2 Tax=Caldalkalibacillus TaxID=379065 RepID=F5LA32_CALTT|nr:hypothetical protein CathTA2_2767 [Caldalkalibacillus thermarum TA2.A1]